MTPIICSYRYLKENVKIKRKQFCSATNKSICDLYIEAFLVRFKQKNFKPLIMMKERGYMAMLMSSKRASEHWSSQHNCNI